MNPFLFLDRLDRVDEIPPHTEIYLLLSMKNEDLRSRVEEAILHGFGDPVVLPHTVYRKLLRKNGTKSYLGSFDRGLRLCLHYLSRESERIPIHEIVKQVDYILHHCKKDRHFCQSQLRFTQNTLDLLHYHTECHRVGNEQREISGLVYVRPESPHMVVASIDDVKVGEKENADYHKSFGSFHTHPLDAYKRHKVCVAFPSAEDYATTLFLYANGIGAFHVLSSIEGIYVISMKPSFVRKHSSEEVMKNLKKWEKHVMKHYDDGYPECSVSKVKRAFWKRYIGKYLKHINKNKVFDVQFRTWDEAHLPFQLRYQSFQQNCIVTDQQFRHLNRFSIAP